MREPMKVMIGPWAVVILPKTEDIAESDLQQGASAATRELVAAAGTSTRKKEVLRSRWLLRSYFGIECEPERAADGNLLWQSGVCGSISHKKGHVAALATQSGNYVSIGIDLEQFEVPDRIVNRILTTEEQDALSVLGTNIQCAAAGFAVKEALFKAIYPLTQKRFWFEDAVLSHIQKDGKDTDLYYTLSADIGPRAGGPENWGRQCTVFLRRFLLEGEWYWLTACGVDDTCFNTVSQKL